MGCEKKLIEDNVDARIMQLLTEYSNALAMNAILVAITQEYFRHQLLELAQSVTRREPEPRVAFRLKLKRKRRADQEPRERQFHNTSI
jgi:hypothetical protein